MSELAEITKAPLAIKVDDKDFFMSPLEPVDLGEVERWLQTLPFERARRKLEALGEQATPEARDRLIRQAEKEAEEHGFDAKISQEILCSLEGVGYLLWLSLRHRHPEITRQEAFEILTLENLEIFQQRLDEVSGLRKKEKPHPTGQNSRDRRRKRRKVARQRKK